KEGRIVNVPSMGHRFAKEEINFDQITDKSSYDPIEAYGRSKLANILHANELARQFKVIFKKINPSSHCIVLIILFPYPRCRIGNGLTKETVIEVDQPEDDKPEEESKVAEETIVDDKPVEESKVVDETIATDETKESKVIEQIAEDI
nr:hypothetical protein [Tanacetum cinerariifolium]